MFEKWLLKQNTRLKVTWFDCITVFFRSDVWSSFIPGQLSSLPGCHSPVGLRESRPHLQGRGSKRLNLVTVRNSVWVDIRIR